MRTRSPWWMLKRGMYRIWWKPPGMRFFYKKTKQKKRSYLYPETTGNFTAWFRSWDTLYTVERTTAKYNGAELSHDSSSQFFSPWVSIRQYGIGWSDDEGRKFLPSFTPSPNNLVPLDIFWLDRIKFPERCVPRVCLGPCRSIRVDPLGHMIFTF